MSTGRTTISTWEASFDYKLKEAVETNNGHVFELAEDAFFWAFEFAEKALNTAAGALINFANENRNGAEVKVRIGVHSGFAKWNIQMNKICTVEFENNWNKLKSEIPVREFENAWETGQSATFGDIEKLVSGH